MLVLFIISYLFRLTFSSITRGDSNTKTPVEREAVPSESQISLEYGPALIDIY